MGIILNLNNFLKNNENARKIFGKSELKIIDKQLKGISLKQSEKNRLSRDIRPKFKFIQEVSKYRDEFKLKKGQDIKRIVNKVKDLILDDEQYKNIQAIFFYGSHVKNMVTPRSDIDICVLFKKISLREATEFRIRTSGHFSKKVDIQVFNVLPQKIKREIVLNNRILFSSKKFDKNNFKIKYLNNKNNVTS